MFQSWGYNGKLVILIQKIKVKKWDFNLYFRESKSNHIGVNIAYKITKKKKKTTFI